MHDSSVRCLTTHPGTYDVLQTIARCMRNLPSFRKYTTEMQLLMSRIVRYMRCGKRRVVLRKGHDGYSVYFIFTGSVSVVMDSEGDSVFIKPEVVILRRGACFGVIVNICEIFFLQYYNRANNLSHFCIFHVHTCKTFGVAMQEIALLQNTKRNATVVTAEESEFLIVDREDFIANDIHLKMNDEFQYRFDFFK